MYSVHTKRLSSLEATSMRGSASGQVYPLAVTFCSAAGWVAGGGVVPPQAAMTRLAIIRTASTLNILDLLISSSFWILMDSTSAPFWHGRCDTREMDQPFRVLPILYRIPALESL